LRGCYVIYVPGILDDTYHIQGILMKTWWMYGFKPLTHEMPWAGDEPYEPKLQALIEQIDQLFLKDKKVYLVGASAGASAVLNAYIKRRHKVSGLALICPKINGPETVGDKTYAENPAFKTSMYELQKTLKLLTAEDKQKIRIYYSTNDQAIPYEGSTIDEVREDKLPAIKHGWAILYAISLGAAQIAAFFRSLP
jgi:predicted peptidase